MIKERLTQCQKEKDTFMYRFLLAMTPRLLQGIPACLTDDEEELEVSGCEPTWFV